MLEEERGIEEDGGEVPFYSLFVNRQGGGERVLNFVR